MNDPQRPREQQDAELTSGPGPPASVSDPAPTESGEASAEPSAEEYDEHYEPL